MITQPKCRMQTIPVPVPATEKDLPRSDLRYRLRSGQVVELLNFPMQGAGTLRNVLDTLQIWQRAAEEPEPEYQI
jgi:hypothetical protein